MQNIDTHSSLTTYSYLLLYRYCECFAAGLYCVEPCSCQNCFNKPIHEDLVMKSREVIEARNPLAFAPKVVSTSDTAIDLWVRDIMRSIVSSNT